MRSYQVFASMRPERATAMMRVLSKESPAMFRQAVDAAAIAIKARPVYMRRQPFEKRAEAVRRSLSRVIANPVADELLAVYFLECRKELLTQWLDRVGLAHDDGTLEDDIPEQPAPEQLAKAVDEFLAVDADEDRDLLLRAFAAQEAVDWPALDARLVGEGSDPQA
jgi:hypothetical protein